MNPAVVEMVVSWFQLGAVGSLTVVHHAGCVRIWVSTEGYCTKVSPRSSGAPRTPLGQPPAFSSLAHGRDADPRPGLHAWEWSPQPQRPSAEPNRTPSEEAGS